MVVDNVPHYQMESKPLRAFLTPKIHLLKWRPLILIGYLKEFQQHLDAIFKTGSLSAQDHVLPKSVVFLTLRYR